MGFGNPYCLSITWECNTGRDVGGRLHLKNTLPFSAVPLFTAVTSYTQQFKVFLIIIIMKIVIKNVIENIEG